ncbi:MAG: sulfate transporter CysZ [Oleiphilus sp.]
MNGNLFKGFAYMAQGFHIILQPGFRLFLLVPLVVNIVLFSLLIMWAYSLIDGWMAVLLSWMPDWLGFLEWLLWAAYLVVIVMTLFYGFVAAANLIGAPFYGYLAELTEQHLSGQSKDEPFSWKILIGMIPRTVMRELQKIIYYLPRVIGLLILGLIPGINLVVAFVWILFSGWMMAIQYIDYPADNNHLSFADMRKYLSRHRFTSLGFGLLAFGLTLLPILNFFALPAAVCGAVAFWVNEPRAFDKININFDVEAQKKLTGR